MSNPAAQSVDAELIPILYRQTTLGVVAHMLTSGVLVWLLWSDATSFALLLWVAAVYLLSILRAGSVWVYLRGICPGLDHRFWGHLAAGFGVSFGLLWGVCPWLFLAPDDTTSMVTVCVINIGLGAGAVVALAPHLVTCLAFALPTQLGLITALIAEPRALSLGIAFLASYALVANLSNSVMVHRRLRENIRLTNDNQRLREEAEEKSRMLQTSLGSAREARESAERANAAKTRFLAAASHDLRQPIHAMSLFFETLVEEVKSARTERLITPIRESIKEVDGMLATLLDISKLDAGVVEPHVAPIWLPTLFDRLRSEFSHLAEQRGNRLRVRALDEWVESDELMLRRLLANLLANACRHTANGSILLCARRRQRGIMLAVYDSGVGIPAEKLDEIFVEFQQLGNPQRDRSQGLGLGLAIVKRIAGLLDHPLEVQSRVARGSMFSVTVPLAQPPARTEFSNASDLSIGNQLQGAEVLVLDDDRAILEATAQLLDKWGVATSSALDLKTAQTLLRDGLRPQLMLIDYRLAGAENGIDAIDLLRQTAGCAIPAILITGDTAPDRLRQAQSSGVTLLHKPLLPARLRAAMRSVLNVGATGSSQVTTGC